MIKDFLKRWHGVVLTIVTLMVIHLAAGYSTHISPVLLFAPLAYTAYHHGLRPAIGGGAVVILYAFYTLPLDQAAQMAIAVLLVSIPMGALKRRARFTESINGNLAKIREIRLLARFLLDHRAQMNDGLIFRFLGEIEDRAGNLEAMVWGWEQIKAEAREAEAKLKRGLFRQAELEIDNNEGDQEKI